jgi:F0F1-type ATP synthase assembly protein I
MVDESQDGKDRRQEIMRTAVKADRMIEMALTLPASVFVGWLLGLGLDRWLHQHWIYMAGIFLGIGAGFMQIFRLLRDLEREIDKKKTKGDAGQGQAKAGNDKIDEEHE